MNLEKQSSKFQIKEQNMNPISKARIAHKKIKSLSLDQRIELIDNFRKYILENDDLIVKNIQNDTKKSSGDAYISEIFGVLEHLDFLLHKAKKHLKDKKVHTPIAMLGKKSRIYMDPLGVILIISPWNYPFYQAIVPITTALVTGNAVVYKPSELTPMTGFLEEVLEKTLGEFRDCVQIIYGDGQTGKELIDHRPDKIFFTGSVRTGKKIMKQASDYLIPVELELGGKDPMLVFENCVLERAVRGALWGSMTNCGQSCTSTERIFVHENIYSEFKEKLIIESKKIIQKVDNDGSSDIGVMTSPAQIQIIKEQLEDALTKGAVQLSGHEWDKSNPSIPPIILDKVDSSMMIYNEETFGPLVWIKSFSSTQEAIELANDSKYGLTASIWNTNISEAQEIAHQLEVGGVSINNVMLTEGNHELPFGGVKNSGIGRYKGEIGLYSFCNIKSIIIDGGHKKIDPNWYPYTPEKYNLFKTMTHGLFGGGVANFIKFGLNGLKLESLSTKLGMKGRK